MTRVGVLVGQTFVAAVVAFVLVAWLRPAPDVRPQAQPVASSTVEVTQRFGSDHSSFRDAARAAMPSVVNIYTAQKLRGEWRGATGPGHDYGNGAPERVTSLGSGVIWRGDGYIVTNNHVVEGADEIAVVVPERPPMQARVIGVDPESDLAVLRVPAQDLPVVSRGDVKALEIGDVVLAIGNPYGVGQTVTQGIVSATGRNHVGINTFENFIQTDAAINPGNSGGALVDVRGRLVGINSAIYTQSQGSVGIGFAIPVDLVAMVVEQLMTGSAVRRGWLGLQTQDVDVDVANALNLAARQGALVRSVEVGGPAARAGVKPGDVVTSIGDRLVADSAGLVALAAAGRPGDRVQVRVNRQGSELTLSVALGERPTLRPQRL